MLTPQTVHIWQLSLAQPKATREKLFHLLAPDEQQRANRFYFERDQTHFIIARGGLRLLLSQYLNCLPEAIEFEYTEQGKPSLVKPAKYDYSAGIADVCYFNLAHSKDIAMYAVTSSGELGIDVEYHRHDIHAMEIADRYFTVNESNYLRQCFDEEERQRAFFNGWSRKEAFLKAIGQGLGYPLHAIEVDMQSVAPYAELTMRGNDVMPWSLFNLPAPEHYSAAIVLPKMVNKIINRGEINLSNYPC